MTPDWQKNYGVNVDDKKKFLEDTRGVIISNLRGAVDTNPLVIKAKKEGTWTDKTTNDKADALAMHTQKLLLSHIKNAKDDPTQLLRTMNNVVNGIIKWRNVGEAGEAFKIDPEEISRIYDAYGVVTLGRIPDAMKKPLPQGRGTEEISPNAWEIISSAIQKRHQALNETRPKGRREVTPQEAFTGLWDDYQAYRKKDEGRQGKFLDNLERGPMLQKRGYNGFTYWLENNQTVPSPQ